MSFPRYEWYKDSGVEWLGEIPEHWETRRLRVLFEIKKRIAGVLGPDVLSITQQGIKVRDTESNDGQLAMDYSKYQIVEPGDFAMNHMDLLTGYVDISNTPGVTSPDYRVFTVRDRTLCDDRYFLYLFQNAYKRKIFYAFGQGSSQLGRWRLPTEAFNDFGVPLPTAAEQSAIVRFLDSETGKIDELIEEQRRLIELLKEKRQAVISHAITKGIKPHVQMKSSGIQWLDTIPAGWDVRSLSSLSTKITNGFVGPTRDIYVEEGIRYLQSMHIKSQRIVADNAYFVSREWSDAHSKSILEAGDVLIVQTGDVGQSAVVTDEFAGSNCHALIIVAPRRDLMDGEWLSAITASDYGFQTLLSIQTGALHPHLNCGDVKDLFCPLPPLSEQREIISWLRKRRTEFDGLIAVAESAISLFQERRSALISAGVTGKIDVRNYAPSEAADLEEAYEPA